MQLLRNAAAHGAGVGSNFRPIQTVYKRSVRTNIQFTNLKVGSISFVQKLCSFSQSILNLKKFHLFKKPTNLVLFHWTNQTFDRFLFSFDSLDDSLHSLYSKNVAQKTINDKQYTCPMKQNYKYFINKQSLSINNFKT